MMMEIIVTISIEIRPKMRKHSWIFWKIKAEHIIIQRIAIGTGKPYRKNIERLELVEIESGKTEPEFVSVSNW